MSFGRNSRALNKQPLSNAVTRLGIRTEELQGDDLTRHKKKTYKSMMFVKMSLNMVMDKHPVVLFPGFPWEVLFLWRLIRLPSKKSH